jgi:hypothetical protein
VGYVLKSDEQPAQAAIEHINAIDAAHEARHLPKMSLSFGVPPGKQDITRETQQVSRGADGAVTPVDAGTLDRLPDTRTQLGITDPVAPPAIGGQYCKQIVPSVGAPCRTSTSPAPCSRPRASAPGWRASVHRNHRL